LSEDAKRFEEFQVCLRFCSREEQFPIHGVNVAKKKKKEPKGPVNLERLQKALDLARLDVDMASVHALLEARGLPAVDLHPEIKARINNAGFPEQSGK
jgi:hypothetical protein